MRRLIWIIIILLGIALASLYVYWNWFYTPHLYFKAVPDDAVAFVDVANMDSLRETVAEKNYWTELKQFDWFNKVDQTSQLLDSMFWRPPAAGRKRVLSSLHVTSHDDYHVLLAFHKNTLVENLAQITRRLKFNGIDVSSRVLRNVNIYEIRFKDRSERLAIANAGEMVMASLEPQLVDDAVIDYSKGSNDFWWKHQKKEEKYDATLYLNFRKFKLLSSLFSKEPNGSWVSKIAALLEWMQFDINFKKTHLALDGNVFFQRSDLIYPKLLNQNGGTDLNIPHILPQNTAVVMHGKVADLPTFGRKLGGSYYSTFQKYVQGWAANEWAYGFTEPGGGTFDEESFLVMGVKDKEKAIEDLEKLVAEQGPNLADASFKNYALKNINAEGVVGHLMGAQVGTIYANAYYTFVDSFVVFSPAQRFLQVFLEKYDKGLTLSKERDFNDFLGSIDKESNLSLYVQTNFLKQLLMSNASHSFANSLRLKYDYYKMVSPLGLQFKKSGWSGVELTGALGFKRKDKEETTLLWSTSLGDEAAMAPRVVKNHLTGEKEIIIQDKSNILYLLSKNGKILWERKFDKPILGAIHQVDFHNNGKLQYLFNTANKIYLLNREGKDVYGYPIRLSASANTGLSIVDLKDRNNFYTFIPCGNNSVYGYEYSGIPMEGWRPRKWLSLSYFPVLHFQYSSQHYIIVSNVNGNIYMLDEKGKMLKKIPLGSKIVSPPEVDLRKGVPTIVAQTAGGMTYYISPSGQKTTKKLAPASSSMSLLTDNVIGSNELQEHVFISANKVFVYNDKERIASYDFPDGVIPSKVFTVKTIGSEANKVGVYCKESQQIYLLEKYGNFHPDFPLPATTSFTVTDLLGSGADILIAGGGERNVYAYRLQ